jgi:diguanylate cyclase (GGDEF)-like protein
VTPVEKLLRDDVRLPSAPAIAVRILDLVKRDNFTFHALGEIIQADPALTSRILRLANSGCYGLPQKVSNYETAVAVLGGNALKNIALSFIIAQVFQGKRGDRFDFSRLWRRSVTSAVAGQLLSSEIRYKNDDIFITTLLQDIGIGAMFLCRRNDYLAVLDEKAVSGRPLAAVEREIFDFDHQDVGSEMLKMWGLPENVYLPIKYHHDTEGAPLHLRPLCQLIQASDRISAVYYGSGTVRNVRRSKELLAQKFDLNEKRAMNLIDSVAQKSDELLSQFNIESRKTQSYSELLQKANEELSRLNFSCETLIVEYRESKARSELLATELKAANSKLRNASFRDDLSGLYNHRFFHESLTGEIEAAERYRHPVSVIMLDVDNFKTINDTHGHQIGDAVLRAVGQYLQRTSRASDIPARYGGDEFVILLRDTTIDGARIRARAICSEIAATPIQIDGISVDITVSVGVAGYHQRAPVSKNQLINLADKAMYQSKRDGRNRVSVREEND